MQYFKNTELAKFYNVSEKTIRNWLAAASEGKLDLQLYEENGKHYVANTSRNVTLIENLVTKGKKYKNTRGFRVVTPQPELYKIFNTKEIYDIISNLDIYREIPHRYSYVNGGAAEWDRYVRKLAQENTSNILSNTVELLDQSTPYLDSLVGDAERVNIIDIGPGNCYPVRKLVEHFADTGQLNRYIGIDVSRSMLQIAKQNITKWFGDAVTFEGAVRDINYERFKDLLASDLFGKESTTRNIVLFLGSTISNFRTPSHALQVIHESIGKDDLVIFSKQLDTVHARRYFDFSTQDPTTLISKERLVLDLLNIDPSMYDVELFFDEQSMARRTDIRLKLALSVELVLDGQSKVVSFNKGERIMLWQHKHQNLMTTLGQFDECGFRLMQATRSRDQECLLAISKIKTNDVSY